MIKKRIYLDNWKDISTAISLRKNVFEKFILDERNFVFGYWQRDSVALIGGIVYLDIDTKHFGFKLGELLNPICLRKTDLITQKKIIKDILTEASDNGFYFIVAKCPSEDISALKILTDLSFNPIVTNIILKRDLSDAYFLDERPINKSVIIRFATLRELKQLRSLALKSFSAKTRFHLDGNFSNRKSSEFHGVWIENLLRNKDARVWCAYINSNLAGFITCKISKYNDFNEKPIGYIDLIAVDAKYRKKGVGSMLIKTATDYLKAKVATAILDTESINYPALRLYQKNNFIINGSRLVLHKWLHNL